MKTAVASGPARRFVVGDPHIQQLDVLVGDTLNRMAAGEELAQPITGVRPFVYWKALE